MVACDMCASEVAPGELRADTVSQLQARIENCLALVAICAAELASRASDSVSLRIDDAHSDDAIGVSHRFGIEVLTRDRCRYAGQAHGLGHDQWLLLHLLVAHPDGAEHSDIGERIWGDPTKSAKSIATAGGNLRVAFSRLGIPLRVSHKSGVAHLTRVSNE